VSVWLTGRAVPDADSGAALDRGLLLGDGLFETVLVVAGAVRHVAAHLARLRASAVALGILWPEGLEETLATAVPALWGAENEPQRAALRVTLTRGSGRGLEAAADAEPGLWIALSPLPPAAVGEPVAPVRAVIVDQPRIDPESPLAGHKTLSALAWVMARRTARSLGADVALVRTVYGDVAEADTANVFAVLDGRLVTPPLARGVLPGVTRARALAVLAPAGTPVEERPLAAADLAVAAEVFLTSSLAGVTPVAAVGDRTIEAPGPVACELAALLDPTGPPEGRMSPPDARAR